MKKIIVFSLIALLAIGLVGCAADNTETDENNEQQVTEVTYDNGTYRGIFADGGEFQVNIQFTLEDNVVTAISFRQLGYKGANYRNNEDETIAAIGNQHVELVEYLIGKDIRENLEDLRNSDYVDDIDGFTGATLRGNKVISAIRDALNRGVYSF